MDKKKEIKQDELEEKLNEIVYGGNSGSGEEMLKELANFVKDKLNSENHCLKREGDEWKELSYKLQSEVSRLKKENSIATKIEEGLKYLTTFKCQHTPDCNKENRGALCNSCWAREWAIEELKK